MYKIPDEPSEPLPNLIEQSDSDCEKSDHILPVFVLERGNGVAQPNEDDESIIPIKIPQGAPPPNIPFVDLDDAPVASDSSSVADSHNPDKPDPEHLL